jgi:excisionase family DNA binding protein
MLIEQSHEHRVAGRQEKSHPMATIAEHVLAPDPSEQAELTHLNEVIEHIAEEPTDRRQVTQLVAADGTSVELPASAFKGLRAIADDLAHGRTVVVMPHDRLLTTNEAAGVLSISRQFLVRLLDGGEIPFERVGTHRRLAVADVLAYREERAARRREKLDELTELSQDYEGGYR